MDERKIIKIPNVFEKVSKNIFPFPLRCMIVGRSGCEKTTVFYNLITQKWGIPFQFFASFLKIYRVRCLQGIKKGLLINQRLKRM